MSQHVVSIGYGRHMFDEHNVEYARMQQCAAAVARYDMIIFTLRSDACQTVVSGSLHIHPTNSRTKLHMLWDAYRLTRQLHQNTEYPMVVTTQDPFAAGLVGWYVRWRLKVWLVVQEHGDFFSLPYWRQERVVNRFWYWIGRLVLRRADVIRVVSRRIGDTMRRLYPQATITQLSVSIDPQPFLTATQRQSHTTSEQFEFLTVARLVPQKNLSLLLRAFHSVWQQHPHARLRIVGSGPEANQISALIDAQHPNEPSPVTLADWTDDVPRLMQDAQVYILSSNYEGWARVLIEAMLSQLPAVTTDVGCAGEVLQHEQHGLVVPVNNQAALAAAMTRMIEDADLYAKLVCDLQGMTPAQLPGTQVDTYGQDWVQALG